MAITFVFTDEEENRAKKMDINYMRLEHTTEEDLFNTIDDPFMSILMPFFKDTHERELLVQDFKNQVIRRKVWTGCE